MTDRSNHPFAKPIRARRLALAGLLGLTLALGACGGDDEPESVSDAGTEQAIRDETMTASEFVLLLEDEKIETMERIFATTPQCENVDPADRDVLTLLSVRATEADPEEPIADVIADNC
jgi:hypothetical protein